MSYPFGDHPARQSTLEELLAALKSGNKSVAEIMAEIAAVDTSQIITSQDMAASFDTKASPLAVRMRAARVQLIESGGPGTHVGDFQILYRAHASADWVALYFNREDTGARVNTVSAADGVAVEISISIPAGMAYDLAVDYDFTSGTGTLNGYAAVGG